MNLKKTLKGNSYMEKKCYFCGNTCKIGYTTISDGTTYCHTCSKKARIVKEYFECKWNRFEANEYLHYHKFAQENYRPIFNLEYNEGDIVCDLNHGLFYFAHKKNNIAITDYTLILSINNVNESFIIRRCDYKAAYRECETHYYDDGTSSTFYTDMPSQTVILEKLVVETIEPKLRLVQHFNSSFLEGLSYQKNYDGVVDYDIKEIFNDYPYPRFEIRTSDKSKSYVDNINDIIDECGILDIGKLLKLNSDRVSNI